MTTDAIGRAGDNFWIAQLVGHDLKRCDGGGGRQGDSADSAACGHGILVAIVTFPDAEGDADLSEIVDATDFLGLFLGRCERGQEHGGKNRDDRDDDEEFDERERFFSLLFHNFSFVLYRGQGRDSRRIIATVNTDG